MTDISNDIEWGLAISVDGKRPGWLEDEATCAVRDGDVWCGLDDPLTADYWQWSTVTAFRLDLDHPHYRQPAPIDWSGELEAVHEDGRVVPVKLFSGPDNDGDYAVRPAPDGSNSCFRPDGSKWVGRFIKADTGWRIRNVTPQSTPQADTKPDVTARMEALVRRMALADICSTQTDLVQQSIYDARAIVALLPEPVDPDLIEARRIVSEQGYPADYDNVDDDSIVGIAYACLKRGRELALAGETGK